MDFSVLLAGLAFLANVFNIQINSNYEIFDEEDKDDEIVWSCKEAVWDKEPTYVRSRTLIAKLLEGEIHADCEFEAVGGGGYPQLIEALKKELEAEAKTIHKGPLDEVYEKLPSVFYDVTVHVSNSKKTNTADIRQDVHIASNRTDRLVFDTISTEIEGKGRLKYLKKVDILAEVRSTDTIRKYEATIGTRFRLEKPWWAPSGTFKKEIKSRVEKEIPETEKELLTRLAKNI